MRVGVVGLIIFAGAVLSGPMSRADAPAPGSPLALSTASPDVGYVSFALRGPPGATVEVRERVGSARPLVARIGLSASGAAERRHAVRWRCDRRARSFVATVPGSAPATSSITTRSCAHRLQMIVAPGRLRPGKAANVRVSDAWSLGGISAAVCARSGTTSAGCRTVRLRRGDATVRARVRPRSAGRWAFTLRTRFGEQLTRRVSVRRGAHYRVLVTGDSMTYGLFEGLGSQLRTRGGQVTGDPHPATGITSPPLDWPAHARNSASSVRPDVTIVFLGAAADAFPLTTPAGQTAQCCGRAWAAEYSRRVRGMMASYLRDGLGIVYWILLPAPRDPRRVEIPVINGAVRTAAAQFSDGVRVIHELADVVSPGGVFHESILYRGVQRVVRAPDGIHLAKYGVRIGASILLRALRQDGIRG
ncbi:MAG: uncharacterized protein QOG15_411 [Solirubrobacteraceae bacterium]|jgi:hypothetical protein|nr:uncharacterized protein [Solirubrobacteraceae bacterium]